MRRLTMCLTTACALALGASGASAAPAAKAAFPGHLVLAFGFRGTNYPVTEVTANGSGRHDLDLRVAGRPSFSPDGQSVAYPYINGPIRPDGTYPTSIYVRSADGAVKQVSPAGLDSFDPDWSPDGKRIAYAAGGSETGLSHIRVVRPDGSDDHVIGGTANGNQPSWAPDSRRLVFFTFDGNIRHLTRLYVVSTNTGIPSQICARLLTAAPAPNTNRQPEWSPDGKLIEFHIATGLRTTGIEVVRPDGSDARLLDGRPDSIDSGGVWVRGEGVVGDHVTGLTAKTPFDDAQLISPNGKITQLFRHTIESALYGYLP